MEDLKICEKRRYETEEEAKKVIAYVFTQDHQINLRTYKCHVCNFFHLTSQKEKHRG